MSQCLSENCTSEADAGGNYCAAHQGDVVHGDMAVGSVPMARDRAMNAPRVLAGGSSPRFPAWLIVAVVVLAVLIARLLLF